MDKPFVKVSEADVQLKHGTIPIQIDNDIVNGGVSMIYQYQSYKTDIRIGEICSDFQTFNSLFSHRCRLLY